MKALLYLLAFLLLTRGDGLEALGLHDRGPRAVILLLFALAMFLETVKCKNEAENLVWRTFSSSCLSRTVAT